MLSYLKQQNNELPENENTGQTEENTEKQDEKTLVSSSSESVKKSTYLLCILFIVGIGVLFYMIRESSPQKAKGSVSSEDEKRQARINQAIERFTGAKTEMSNGIDKVVNEFNQLETTQQVGVNGLKKNPFITDSSSGNNDSEDRQQGTFNSQALKEQKIRQQASQLLLSSIMEGGDEKDCIINDEIYREGDKVQGFEIAEIGGEYVVLLRDGVEIVLHLQTGY